MKKYIIILILLCAITVSSKAQIKILFDATKAETAGNADWVIDADLFNIGYSSGPATIGGGNEANPQKLPTPLQATVTSTTAENYWKGGISAWGIDCVKKGYEVETLPYNGAITYNNASNAQDLSNYKIFVVVEPNIVFTTAEKTAILNFVHNGGSLFMVSDHTISDRNNDGWDSPAIWNDLFTNNGTITNPFGMSFDLANISGSSTNVTTNSSDSLIHGSFGTVSQILWSNGTTITINPTINPTVKAAVYKTGASNTGTTNVMVAYARYGQGKVVVFGDSSPFDDGTGDTGDQLYDGYFTDAAGNHQKLIMNATIWLATTNPLPVKLTAFNALQENNNIVLHWSTATEINTSYFNIQKSTNGNDFKTMESIAAKGFGNYEYIDNNATSTTLYYRLEILDKDGSKTYSQILSVNNQHTVKDVCIFPNPAKNIISIQANNIKEYQIFNAYGICVKQNSNIDKMKTISIVDLLKGYYVLKLTTISNTIITKKIIKQ